MKVPTRSKRWIYCIGWIRTMLFILFLQKAHKWNPQQIECKTTYCRTSLYGPQGVLGYSLLGAFRHQYFSYSALFFQIWYLEISRESPNLARCITAHQARTRSLPSCFWRNVRRFSRAFYVKYRDQVLLTAFFEAFAKGWWWKMSGGNRNSHWKSTTFSVKRKRDCHLSLRLRLSWSSGVFSWTGSLSSLRRLKVHMECFI